VGGKKGKLNDDEMDRQRGWGIHKGGRREGDKRIKERKSGIEGNVLT
jgi:hypothetical protein